MQFLRRMMISSVLLLMYTAAIVVYLCPASLLSVPFLLIGQFRRKGSQLTSHGSARWADAADIPQYLE